MGVSLPATAAIIGISFVIIVQAFSVSVPPRLSEISDAYDDMKNRSVEQCQTDISITNITKVGWWDTDWNYRKMIVIDYTKVQADQTDFPVLIYRESDEDLAAHAQPDGDDIFFTDDNNSTKLSHEIENYSSITGEFTAWVKIPIIYANKDTVLLMYYGNAGCGSQQDISDTWDSNFKMVQHLNESSGTLYDSTSNDNDGTNNGSAYNASSKIDGGYDFDGNDYVLCDDDNSLDIINQITLEAWVKDPPIFLSTKKQDIVKNFDKKAINITTAEHLDKKRNFLRNIYEYVKLKDNKWSEPINNGEYVRVTFEDSLDESNYITIFARSSGISQIKIYPQNNDSLITTVHQVTDENWYKVYLTNLKNECDTFDFQTIGNPVEYDYIVDPETKDAVDNNTSDVDNSADKGTETNFANAQDTSPDTDFMTIQEGDQGIPAVNDNLVVTGFTSTWTAWDEYGSSPYLGADGDGSYIFETTTDLHDEGWFTFADTTATGSGITTVLYVDFDAGDGNDDCNWYIDTTGDNTPEFSGRFTNPTTAIVNTGTISGLDTATEINAARLWLEYDSTGTRGDMIVDYAYLNIQRAQVIDYEIDFEYNWSNADFDEDCEEVCIYVTSHIGSETLNVNYWSGSWINLGQITSTGWTNLTATGLTDATYEIQLIGASESGDTSQDSWDIDVIMLHTWPKLNTSVNTISPYLQRISPLNITASNSTAVDNVTLYYRWSAHNFTGWDVMTYDDFEVDFGNYTDGGIDCSLYTGGTYAHQGSNAALIQDNSGIDSSFYHTNTIDLATPGYQYLKVDFWFYAVSMDPGEDFWVQFNNGGGWITVADYDSGDEFVNGQFYHEIVWINESDYDLTATSQIAFQCDASANDDNVYIDQIWVNATTIVGNTTNWMIWSNGNNPDTSIPWQWNFNFPNGAGYYEFYSIGKKAGLPDEIAPINADAICRYSNNTAPFITNESPTNGSSNVSLNPILSIQVNDSENHQMNITWYWGTNSTCPNFIGINNSVNNGTYFMINDNNFSSVSKTYYWKVVVNDRYGGWTNATYHFRTTGYNKEIISKERDAYALEISADGITLYGIINNTNVTTSTDANWHYVVLTYNGTTIKLYEDGKLKNSTTLIGSIPTNDNDLLFGDRLTGTLDELRISAIARSPEWINTTYKMTSSPTSFIRVETEQNQQYTYLKIKIKNTGSTTIKTHESTILINGTDKSFIKIQPYLYPLKETNIFINVSTTGSKRNKFITGNGITDYEGYS